MKISKVGTALCLGVFMCAPQTFAQGKATKNLTSTSIQKSISTDVLSKVQLSYWGEVVRKRVDNGKDSGKKTENFNSIKLSYPINSKYNFEFIPRFTTTDDQNQRYIEEDTRIGASGVVTKFNQDQTSLWMALRFEIPHSSTSRQNGKQTKLKLYTSVHHKFDDYNTLILLGTFNKEYREESLDSVDSTSRHELQTWASYRNSFLSEKYTVRIDYEGVLKHSPGKSDLTADGEHLMFNIGSEIKFDKVAFYPYLRHDINATKAFDTLGAGFQLTARI